MPRCRRACGRAALRRLQPIRDGTEGRRQAVGSGFRRLRLLRPRRTLLVPPAGRATATGAFSGGRRAREAGAADGRVGSVRFPQLRVRSPAVADRPIGGAGDRRLEHDGVRRAPGFLCLGGLQGSRSWVLSLADEGDEDAGKIEGTIREDCDDDDIDQSASGRHSSHIGSDEYL